MGELGEALERVRERIRAAVRRYGREPGSVGLVAVSKGRPAAEVRAAFAAGQRAFGESYVSEALAKIEALRDLPIEWHFIGPIQSNKTRAIAERFAWAHGVDRAKVARRLSAQRPLALAPLEVCLEVKVSGERSKSGVAPGEALALAREVAVLPGLRLRGLMAVPAPDPDFERQRAAFRGLRQLYGDLRAAGIPLDTLSMGMTDDMDAAIAEGATLVRIGTAIFGSRPPRTA